MEISTLKEQIELAINERLSELVDRSHRYENLISQMECEHRMLLVVASELKSVEYIIRANGNNTHADLIDDLLEINKKKAEVALPISKKKGK